MEAARKLLQDILSKGLGQSQTIEESQWQSGGDINRAASVTTQSGKYFIKWNAPSYGDMFEKEARGLSVLAAACPLKIPEVIAHGTVDTAAFLILEQLERGIEGNEYWEQLGEGLAALHLHKNDLHGLDHDNYIGRLSQVNSQADTWVEFFTKTRLMPQLELALSNNYVSLAFAEQMRSFLDKLPQFMPDADASLLHGDLWSGNVMPVAAEQASIYDPAIYWGAREMDLAMTRLFGGFDSRFYQAYHSVYPIPSHFEDLLEVYNLYPLMVHVNLFGPNSGYSDSVRQITQRYL